MQCKDIADLPVLSHLEAHGGIGCTVWRGEDGEPINKRSALHAMPPDTPEKLARAKMAMLKKRGLVDGCGCGCRGDWELTPAGRQWLADASHETPNDQVKRRPR